MKKIKLSVLALIGSMFFISCNTNENSINTATTDELAEKVFALIETPTQWSKKSFTNAFISYDKLCEIYKAEASEEAYKKFTEDFPSKKEYEKYLSEIIEDDFTLSADGESQLKDKKLMKFSTSFDEVEKQENGLSETTGEMTLSLLGESLSLYITAIYYDDRYWLTELDLY